MNVIIFFVVGAILWQITEFGINNLNSETGLLDSIKKWGFWLILSPFLLVYVLIGIAGFINSTDGIEESFSDKKTVYFSYCPTFIYPLNHNIYSCPDDTYLATTKASFKISFEKQIVVQDMGSVSKYTQCNVFDTNNWSCDIGDRHIAIQDGSYSDFDRNNPSPTIDENKKPSFFPSYSQIMKSEYLIREITRFFRSLF